MSNVLQIDRNGIDEAVNDLQELINEINEVNISKSKQEGDEGMAYTAIQEVEKIIENVKDGFTRSYTGNGWFYRKNKW